MNDLKKYSWLIILLCAIISVAIGIWYGEKQVKNQKISVISNPDGTHTITLGGIIFKTKPEQLTSTNYQ